MSDPRSIVPATPVCLGNGRHRSRCRNGARVASSVDGPFEGRSVARTDLDATMTNVVSSTVPASSPALARFWSFSRAEEDGSDEERSRIGHQHVWARAGDSRIEPQELQTVSANVAEETLRGRIDSTR